MDTVLVSFFFTLMRYLKCLPEYNMMRFLQACINQPKFSNFLKKNHSNSNINLHLPQRYIPMEM